MKVGIITLFGDNYGNKLQNYALQQLLLSIGCSPETIRIKNGLNYLPKASHRIDITKFHPAYILNSLTCRFNEKFNRKNQRDGMIKSILYTRKCNLGKLRAERSVCFHEFSQKHLLVSDNEIDANQIMEGGRLEEFDYFVCGSDQVWNRTKAPYFLTFAPQKKRVAFAPSFGMGTIPDYLIEDYRKWISEIPYLSVREERGQEIIRELTGKSAVLLPDPTLCLSADEWIKIENKPYMLPNGPFVVTYFLGNETNQYRKYIERYASDKGYNIIDLYDLRESDYYSLGPSEFVWLVHQARAVFTDSFHATVFSIIFHKSFVVFRRMESGGNSMRSRIDTLLHTFHLESRKFDMLPIEQIDDIAFAETDVLIEQQREKAVSFLKGSMCMGM